MRAKLDENLGERGVRVLRSAGWDVATVLGEGLCSADDERLIGICSGENRVLVSLDKDFSNTLRFPPKRYTGIVVLRVPEPLRRGEIEAALTRVIGLAQTRSPHGRLWIVAPDRIREFAEPDLP